MLEIEQMSRGGVSELASGGASNRFDCALDWHIGMFDPPCGRCLACRMSFAGEEDEDEAGEGEGAQADEEDETDEADEVGEDGDETDEPMEFGNEDEHSHTQADHGEEGQQCVVENGENGEAQGEACHYSDADALQLEDTEHAEMVYSI